VPYDPNAHVKAKQKNGGKFTRARYRKLERAFQAAKRFIESHIADPDLSEEMRAAYAEYQEASAELNEKTGK